jgi:hypothetical protein
MARELSRRTGQRRPGTRRALIGVLAAVSLFAAGCSTHNVAVSHPCPAPVKGEKVVVVSNRGKVGMAKIGLTPKALKAQQKCSS